MNEELVLLPEVQARLALRERPIRLQVLMPVGSWTGCGKLRVLRVRTNGLRARVGVDRGDASQDDVELTVGYESYQP